MATDLFLELEDYNKYFSDQLVLSSTLLGLLIATATFLLQSGFTSFKFSRSMFIKYYISLTKILFLLLAYNIIISVLFLYTKSTGPFIFAAHVCYSLLFIKYLFDFQSHKGYMLTMNTSKFNPYKNKIRRYIRFITNLGLPAMIVAFGMVYVLTFYPVHLGTLGDFTKKQAFIATVIAFAYVVFALIRIIPQYYIFTEMEYKHEGTTEATPQINKDELLKLRETLIKYGRDEFNVPKKIATLGNVKLHLVESNTDVGFFIAYIYTDSTNVQELVRDIEIYVYEFFRDLAGTHVDVNIFVLSCMIEIKNHPRSKNYFFRAKRLDLDKVLSQNSDAHQFVKAFKDMPVVDEIFQGI